MPIDISAELSRPYLPSDSEREVTHGQITIDVGDEDAAVTRHVALCVDKSSSMSGDKIEQAKAGAKYACGLLDSDDYLSIVGFNSTADIEMDATQWGSIDPSAAHDEIEEIVARNGTDIYGGLEQAHETFARMQDDGNVVRRIVLLSDGQDNEKEAGDFESLVEQLVDERTSIMAAGIGSDYDKPTIKTIATTGTGGKWKHLTDDDGEREIQGFIGDEVAAAGTVVETQPSIRFESVGQTEIQTVYRCAPQVKELDIDWRGSTGVIDLPDLHEREEQLLVLEFGAPPGDVGETVELASVVFDGSERHETSFQVEYTDDPEFLGTMNDEPMVNFEAADIIGGPDGLTGEDTDLVDIEERIGDLETVTSGGNQLTERLREQKTKIEKGDETAAAEWETSKMVTEQFEDEDESQLQR